ncbi:MAG: hypothetical protein K0B37_18290 [Bacteroidales bacterium]|nr:hypothetical protein [Bacteroidales bacterium]
MTKSILTSLIFLLMISASAIAQSDAKVIAVVNHASWCPACVGNGERAQGVFTENNKDGAIHFVVNDLSTDESKEKSAADLKKLGLYEAMESQNRTGVAYFFDAETKKLINQVSVAKPSSEIAEAVQTARKGLK